MHTSHQPHSLELMWCLLTLINVMLYTALVPGSKVGFYKKHIRFLDFLFLYGNLRAINIFFPCNFDKVSLSWLLFPLLLLMLLFNNLDFEEIIIYLIEQPYLSRTISSFWFGRLQSLPPFPLACISIVYSTFTSVSFITKISEASYFPCRLLWTVTGKSVLVLVDPFSSLDLMVNNTAILSFFFLVFCMLNLNSQ